MHHRGNHWNWFLETRRMEQSVAVTFHKELDILLTNSYYA
jgi:hypothetical protein